MRTILYSTLLILPLLVSSCFKERDLIMGTPTKLITVHKLRQMHKGEDIELTAELMGTAPINGIVISDATTKNIEANKIVLIQQASDETTSGITLEFTEIPSTNYTIGDTISVSLLGGTLKRVNGHLEVTGLNPAEVYKEGSNRYVEPLRMSLAELEKNFDLYESTLVSVAAVDILIGTEESNLYSGFKKMYDASNEPGTIQLNTLNEANFASQEVPNNANFVGIAMYVDGKSVLRIRNLADISITSIPKNSAADLIITGFLSDPKGSDNPAIGSEVEYSNGVKVIRPGTYEYVQLMALRDIDFSVTPYSVVLANNGDVTAKGWAEGGSVSFKFNITEGTVKAGTFCYVGGPAKKLAGYWNCGNSADISHANWVRSIAMPSVGGDGFGNATYAMSNLGGDGTKTANGIAVFKGTTVTELSVPIDAIFYGTRILGAYNAAKAWGYRIPLTDHYNPVNPETGEAQPFFGQGTNTYIFTNPGSDKSDFPRLGGVVSLTAWLMPREANILTMYTTNCEEAAKFTLESIEEGVGVTYFRK